MENLETAFDDLIVNLSSQNGITWKEIHGEIHAEYGEVPFWILMYEKSDINQVLDEFRKLTSSFRFLIGEKQMTVAFREFSEDGHEMIFHDMLETNEEIERGRGDWILGSSPSSRPFDGNSVFVARNSKR